MKLYMTRAVRCLFKLMILLSVVFAAMALTGTLETHGLPLVEAMFSSYRGWVLIIAIVLWSATYPLTSFTRASIRMPLGEHRDDIVNAFATYGYALDSEEGGRMVFRAKSVLRRVLWQFDDAVTVSQDGGFTDIEGLKRVVPRVETRLKALMGR